MNKKLLLNSAAIIASTLFIGCGGGGGTSSSSPTPTTNASVSGVVSDGLIENANVNLVDASGNVIETTTTNNKGEFTFTSTLDSAVKYTIEATGGRDIQTNESFEGIVLKAPLELYSDAKNSTVISPITTLVAEANKTETNLSAAIVQVRNKLGITEAVLKTAPHTNIALQKKAMKLVSFVKEDIPFSEIYTKLDNNGSIDGSDIDNLTSDKNKKVKLKDLNISLNDASTVVNLDEEYTKARYLRQLTKTNSDLDLEDTETITNLVTLTNHFYTQNKELTNDEILASVGSKIEVADVDVDPSSFSTSKYNAVEIEDNIAFSDSLNVLYYTVANPISNNSQLLAYDYKNKKAHVVNTDVILGSKVFLYEGEVENKKIKYTKKKYGVYLDPKESKETRVATKTSEDGQSSQFTYTFYSNNALKKFDISNPKETSYIFNSSNIPSALQSAGIKVLGSEYKVVENLVDIDNSYVILDGFESLADGLKEEKTEDKLQVKMTTRLADNKAVTGRAILIIANKDTYKTESLLVNHYEPYTPSSQMATYELRKYNKELTSFEKVADGEFRYATQNDDYIYLYKEGSNKLYSLKKDSTSLSEVSGITLAGNYSYDVHAKGSSHGSSSKLIDGGTTLSGRSSSLRNDDSAYVSFHYDLTPNVGKAFVFGEFGAYKNAQIFKLNENDGVKLFDNGDGVDDSASPKENEKISGHVNLIAVNGSKLYTELGWYDSSCTTAYPYPGAPDKACINVKYGYLDISTMNNTDLTVLNYDDVNDDSNDASMEVNNLPYYIARRVSPVAVDDSLYVTLFKGGSSRTGYKYKLYKFALDDASSTSTIDGRTYFNKTHKGVDGVYKGNVILWDQITQGIYKDDGTKLVDTSSINGKPGFSISAQTNGVPLSGIGKLAMLKNNTGGAGHTFELFAVDIENSKLQYIDFRPYGGWIYE